MRKTRLKFKFKINEGLPTAGTRRMGPSQCCFTMHMAAGHELQATWGQAANGFKRLLIDLCSHCNYGSGYGGKTLAEH